MEKMPVLARLQLDFETLDDLQPRQNLHYLLLAALYQVIRETSLIPGVVSERLHYGQPKPFALTPLRLTGNPVDLSGQELIPAGRHVQTRLSALDSETISALALVFNRCQDGRLLTLEHARWRLTSWKLAESTASLPALLSYPDLLFRSQPVTEAVLRLDSPTLFRRGNQRISPEELAPRHFFGSYFDRWRAVSADELAGLERPFLISQVKLDLLRLAQAGAGDIPGKQQTAGYTGIARFRFDGSPETRKVLSALATFASYCGTGSGTAWGMGATTRLVPSSVIDKRYSS